MELELLRRLCETDGISGREDAVAEVLGEAMAPHVDEVTTDAVKNVTGFRKGTGGGDLPRVMLAGHIDEIGFLVNNIDSGGFASVTTVGGWSAINIVSSTVRVHTRDHGALHAVMARRAEIDPEKLKKVPPYFNLYLDFGMDPDEVHGKVARGDWVTMSTPYRELGDCMVAKAFDDRVGAFVIAEAAKRSKSPGIDLYAVGTAQEEVGLRGSAVAAQRIRPHVGVAVDITGSGDIPGHPERMRVTELGKGVAIKYMDSSVISSTYLVDMLRGIAEEEGIDYQMEILPRGGTDTASMQRFGPGAHAACLSIPTRYGHSPTAVIHRHDVETAVELLAAFLDRMGPGSGLPGLP